MRFWIVNPFDNLPGEGRRPLRYWALCRALAVAGHQVTWWSSDFHHAEKRRRGQLPPVYMADDGFQVRLVPTPVYRRNISLARWRSHAAFVRNWERDARAAVATGELSQPGLILTSQPPLGTADAAFRLRRDWNCKVVVDIQDAWPETFYRLVPGPEWLRRRFAPLLFHPALCQARRACHGADGVAAVGQTYLDLAAAHGCRAPRHLCHHGIDLAPAIQRPEFRRENGLRLAYIGFMGASYDLETVLGGVAGLVREGKPVSLDLAGCGPKEVALRRFIAGQPCGVRERLRFHGYLGADELRRLLGESDLGLIPMKPESWVAIPNKAGDYAEAGLAMINGLTGETAALLAQWQAGTSYRVGDPASFSAAIMGYLDNPSRVRQEGANARRLAEERFDRQRIYPAFVRFLEETAAANLPTAGHR